MYEGNAGRTFSVILAAALVVLVTVGDRSTASAAKIFGVGPSRVAANMDTTSTASGVTAFVGVNVLPMDGRGALAGQTVLVMGEMIVRVGPAAEVPVPAGARRIETAEGRWLLPGLTDAHVHLREDPESWLDLFLANGITTVFNLRGDSLDLHLQRRVVEGERTGPTVYTAGPYLDELDIGSVGAADSVLRVLDGAGYDFAKIHGRMSSDAFRWVVEAANRHGMPVVGHVPRNLPLDSALAGGMEMISHAEELVYTGFPELGRGHLPATARRMVEEQVWLTPTLAGFAELAKQWGNRDALTDRLNRPEARYLNREIRAFWTDGNPYVHRSAKGREPKRLRRQVRFQEHMVEVLWDSDVGLLAGTDAPFPTMYPGFSLHEELAALRSAGLAPGEVLRTATSNPGEFIQSEARPDDRFGRLAEGYRADLLLVKADPRDDLTVLREPVGVMARGRWLSRSELDRRLAVISTRIVDSGGPESFSLSRKELRVFTGRYLSESPAFDVRVRVDGRELRVEDTQRPDAGPSYLLVPMDRRRFRVLGGPFEAFAEFSQSGHTLTLRKTQNGDDAFATLRRVQDRSSLPLSDQPEFQEALRKASSALKSLAEEGSGLSAAVGSNGRILWSEGFGWADIAARRPMSTATRARIYSVSKGFTAVAAARLVEEGRLGLDDTVHEYVPGFPEKRGSITPFQLLTHTSGIRHYRGPSEARGDRHCDSVSEALPIFAEDSLVHPPGEDTTYSSWGYVLLSEVLARAGERPFPSLIREEVFEPAGMEATELDDPDRKIDHQARQYTVRGNGDVEPAPPADITCKWGAGGYVSTAEDLVRFQRALLNGDLVSERMIDRIVRSRAQQTGEGHLIHEWSGWSFGGMAFVRTDLKSGLVFALMSNAIGEKYGPEVQAAVPEIHRLFVEAASAHRDTVMTRKQSIGS